ncbi:fatty acid desaturase [Hydrogenophaga palleronii]|uniref:Fatty acid desaturase n=1 Tax=Hydrogenophaga palleronii TaxID=65655 RepID=A0ABU1WPT1_9BURK|nr:fatty acid desaturase [Hydrogenophaga palleronii]MDR7150917.1 fatty acid desaturase [Hydrogenophaga palleronii]
MLARLVRPAPLRLLLQTLLEWLCIFALAGVAMEIASVPVSVACMLLIATRQHALLTLMHDFSHHQFSRQRRALNDVLGDVLTALPFFITVHGFRRNHFQHHAHVATDLDPNWVSSLKRARYQFPMSRTQVWVEVLKHCIGFYTLAELKRYTVDAGMAVELPRAVRITRALFWIAVAGLATYFDLWVAMLLYWLLPLATFLMAILYLRDIGEHYGMPAAGILGSRTVLAGWVERLLIAQNGVNFHAEHHLFPAVPFFRLKRLHRLLLPLQAYSEHAVITRGYLSGLIDEVSGPKPQATAVTHAV